MVSLYYYEELTLREMSEVLVYQSRVSQLHTKAILTPEGASAGLARTRRARALAASLQPPLRAE